MIRLIPQAIVLIVLYLIIILPHQRKKRKREQMISNLQMNDHVITSGGVSGRFVGRKDKLITIEVAPNVRVDVDPAKIESVSAGKQPISRQKCSRCGSPLDPGDRFCRLCSQPARGAASAPSPPSPPPAQPRSIPIPHAAALCPRCRTPLESGILFCGECGMRLK
jgi:preprotein translocase subunit YajC